MGFILIMAKTKFFKGLKANLPSSGLVVDAYYQCTDTGELFLATSATTLVPVGGAGGGVVDVQVDDETVVDEFGVAHINSEEVESVTVGDIISHNADEFVGEAPIDNQSYVRKNGEWTSLGGALNETVVLHISATLFDLPSTTVYVKNKADGSTIHTLTWVGSDLQFIVKDCINYQVEFAAVSSFTTPATQEYTAFGDTVRNLSAQYLGIFTNGVYIGYTDGRVSPYNQLVSGKTPEGVVVKTDNMSILLHPTRGLYVQWSPNESTTISGVKTTTDKTTAKADLAGKKNTDAAIASGKAGGAFTFARGLGAEWYLPACGEMEQIRLNVANINTALGLIGGAALNFGYGYASIWSSTQYSNEYAWCWSSSDWKNGYKSANGLVARAVRAFVI